MKLSFPLPMLVPPPLWFAFTFAITLRLDPLLPMVWNPSAEPAIIGVGGLGLILIGLVFILPSVFRLWITRTTVLPQGSPSRLVASGAYRFSRNPMYVGMTLAYVGLALRMASPGAMLGLVVPLGILNFVVIPFEESRLMAIFGDEYERYRARVRRWI